MAEGRPWEERAEGAGAAGAGRNGPGGGWGGGGTWAIGPGSGSGGYMLGTSGSSPNGCNRFGVKNARAEEICGQKRGGLGKKGGGLGKKCILVGKKLKSLGKKNCIIWLIIVDFG